jgi:hypothetical protein
MIRILRAFGFVILFIGILFTAATLTNRLDPFEDVDQLSEKWTYWKANKDRYDTLFIGTSRVLRGVVPSEFDQATAAAGVPTHTFNFGVDGMLAPEDAYVAEFLLRDPPKNLRWVVLELGAFTDDFEMRAPDNIRSSHWHDWDRSWLCIRSTLWPKQRPVRWQKLFATEDKKASPAADAWTHFRLFVIRTLNLGRGAAAITTSMMAERPKTEVLGPNSDGFFPYPPNVALKGEELANYEKSLAYRKENPPKLAPLTLYHRECVERVLAAARACGAKPILYTAPSIGSRRLLPAEGSDVPHIDLYDVLKYPDLFATPVRADTTHLNPKGASLCTQEVARQFIQITTSQPR